MSVSITDLEIAAEWLEVNDGDMGEAEACHNVSQFLRAEIQRRIDRAAIRGAAKEYGISEKSVREALRRKQ